MEFPLDTDSTDRTSGTHFPRTRIANEITGELVFVLAGPVERRQSISVPIDNGSVWRSDGS